MYIKSLLYFTYITTTVLYIDGIKCWMKMCIQIEFSNAFNNQYLMMAGLYYSRYKLLHVGNPKDEMECFIFDQLSVGKIFKDKMCRFLCFRLFWEISHERETDFALVWNGKNFHIKEI